MLKERRETAILRKVHLASLLLLFLILFSTGLLPSHATESAIVWTDKKEYDPSETAKIFGYGFNAFAEVTVTIERPDLSHDTVLTSTDEFGYFTCQYTLDGISGTFTVTATDGVNTATTTFNNHLSLKVRLESCTIGTFIEAKVCMLWWWKNYYVKYFDPDGVERGTSPTYTGVLTFTDRFIILPTLPKILGTWTVKLYQNGIPKRTRTICINKIVWTTDSTFTTMVTSFAQGETMHFKAIGLQPTKYYRFMLERPDNTKIYVGDWTTGVTMLTGSYDLPTTAQLGTWKLHTREAEDAYGTCEHHFVDSCFTVTTLPSPPQYYLTVQTDPADITTIPGQGWYNACTYANLTAPDFVPGPTGAQYKFSYWDVDGVPQSVDVNLTSIHMDANHTATAHYSIQYYLTLTTDPLGVTVPSGVGWYDAGTNASIFTPEIIGITPGVSRYRFDGWTTADMIEIADPSATSTMVLMDKAKTVTADYVTQYLVTFDQSGVGTDFTGTVVTIDGTGYGVTELPVSFWWDEDSEHSFSFASPLVVDAGKQYAWVSTSGLSTLQSDTLTITGSGSVTGEYKTQYRITFDQTGVGSDFTGTVVTIDGTNYDISALPASFLWDKSSVHSFAFQSPLIVTPDAKQYVWDYTSGLASLQSGAITVSTSGSIVGNYKTQYKLTVRTNGLGTTITNVYNDTNILGTATDAAPYSEWFDEGVSLQLDIDNPITVGSTRFVFTQWSGDAAGSVRPLSITMNFAKDITANYKTQYEVTFDQSGVGTDFTGTVVTIDATGYGVGDLSKSFWWDENSNHDFAFASPLAVNATNQYVWVSTFGLSTLQGDTLTITGSGSVTGNYVSQVQYQITFNQTGVDIDFTGTVVVIDGDDYSVGGLPVSFWWDAGSVHDFSFQSPLVVTPDAKQYVWTSTSDLSSQQSGSITVSESGNITGNYKTQYYLTMSTNFGTVTPGNGWHDAGSTVQISASAPDVVDGERYVWLGWTSTGDGSYSGMDNPATVTMNSSITETATWQHEYRLIMDTNFGTTNPSVGEQWYEAGSTVEISATPPSTISGEQYVWLGWIGTGTGSYSGTNNPASITMDGPITETAAWRHEYYLTVTSPYDSPTPTSGWFEAGESITASVTSPVSGPPDTRYVCTGWTGTGSVPASGTTTTVTFTINAPSSIAWTWKTQYYLTVRTDPTGLSPAPTPPSNWYDNSTNVSLTAPDPSYLDTVEYIFNYWDVDGTTVPSSSISVAMDMPHTATAHYYAAPVGPAEPVGGPVIPIEYTIPSNNKTPFSLPLILIITFAFLCLVIFVKKNKMALLSSQTKK